MRDTDYTLPTIQMKNKHSFLMLNFLHKINSTGKIKEPEYTIITKYLE